MRVAMLTYRKHLNAILFLNQLDNLYWFPFMFIILIKVLKQSAQLDFNILLISRQASLSCSMVVNDLKCQWFTTTFYFSSCCVVVWAGVSTVCAALTPGPRLMAQLLSGIFWSHGTGTKNLANYIMTLVFYLPVTYVMSHFSQIIWPRQTAVSGKCNPS